MSDKSNETAGKITIKKYANRRLYNTDSSRYVTLEALCQMVKDGIDFVVIDAKSGQDITRGVLTQIIVEEEGKGENLLPTSFLRSLIAMYGNNMQWLVPQYLDYMMRALMQNQEDMQKQFSKAFGNFFPFANPMAMGRQNMQAMENAMRMFNPFLAAGAPNGGEGAEGGGASQPKAMTEEEMLAEFERQAEELKARIRATKGE